MLVAAALTILGLVAGVVAAQLRGLRLTGVIVVPLSTVYLLKNFAAFPVFVVSSLAAFVSLWLLKRRLLVYGRTLFILAVSLGTAVLVMVFELITLGYEPIFSVSGFELLLSILPGIAAFNLHRLSEDEQVLDAVWTLATVLFFTVVGIGLVIVVGLTPLVDVLPPVLLSSESDIAVAFGVAVDDDPLPVIASRNLIFGLFISGLVVSELVRSRYGLRIMGVVVVPVVVLMSFRNGWMLPLWILTSVVAYVGVQLLHWLTLLYGRVLLSMSIIFGLLFVVSVTPLLSVRTGLLPFFVGILGGVSAYNTHVVPPTERPLAVLATCSVFVGTVGVARLFVTPPASGMLTTVSGVHVVVGLALFTPGVLVALRLEQQLFRHRRALEDRPAEAPTRGGGRGYE